jgi:hypothetical protein
MLRLSEVEVHTIPESPGLYILCWIKEGNVVPVPRILGIDKAGILHAVYRRLARRLKSS